MRCPSCGGLRDRVVDSRQADDGQSIRRRRQCETCGGRFTTFERLENAPLVVSKRDGRREPFDRSKIVAGVTAAAKSRPVTAESIDELAINVEDHLRMLGREVTSDEVGTESLTRLRSLDGVSAVRFASVYKSFEDVSDFEREITLLDDDAPAGVPRSVGDAIATTPGVQASSERRT